MTQRDFGIKGHLDMSQPEAALKRYEAIHNRVIRNIARKDSRAASRVGKQLVGESTAAMSAFRAETLTGEITPKTSQRMARVTSKLKSELEASKTGLTIAGDGGKRIPATEELGTLAQRFGAFAPQLKKDVAARKAALKSKQADEKFAATEAADVGRYATAETRRIEAEEQKKENKKLKDVKSEDIRAVKVREQIRSHARKIEISEDRKAEKKREADQKKRAERIEKRRVQRQKNIQRKAGADDTLTNQLRKLDERIDVPEQLRKAGVLEEQIQPEVYQDAKAAIQQKTRMALANDKVAQSIGKTIPQLQQQALVMEKNTQKAQKYVKTYGFGVQQRSYEAAKGFAALGSTAQGAVLGMSALEGNILNVAFSLIFLQFSMAPLALGIAALTAGTVLWMKAMTKANTQAEKIRKIGLQMRNLNISAQSTAIGGKLIKESVDDFGFEAEDASKAMSLLIQNVDNYGSAFNVVRDIAADTGNSMETVAQAFLDTIKATDISVGSLEDFKTGLDNLIPAVVRADTPLENLIDTATNWYAQIGSSIDPTERSVKLLELLRGNWESINVQNKAISREGGLFDHIFGGTDFEKAERFQQSLGDITGTLSEFMSAPQIAQRVVEFSKMFSDSDTSGILKDFIDFNNKVRKQIAGVPGPNIWDLTDLLPRGVTDLTKLTGTNLFDFFLKAEMPTYATDKSDWARKFITSLFPYEMELPPSVVNTVLSSFINIADDVGDLIPGFEMSEFLTLGDQDALASKVLAQMALVSDKITAKDGYVEYDLRGTPHVFYGGKELTVDEFSAKRFPSPDITFQGEFKVGENSFEAWKDALEPIPTEFQGTLLANLEADGDYRSLGYWKKNGFTLHPTLWSLLQGPKGKLIAAYLKEVFEANPQTISTSMSDEDAQAIANKARSAVEDGIITPGELTSLSLGVQLYAKGDERKVKSWHSPIDEYDATKSIGVEIDETSQMALKSITEAKKMRLAPDKNSKAFLKRITEPKFMPVTIQLLLDDQTGGFKSTGGLSQHRALVGQAAVDAINEIREGVKELIEIGSPFGGTQDSANASFS